MVDGRDIERTNPIIKITPQVLVSIQWVSGANQCLSEICIDMPISAFILDAQANFNIA